MARNPLTPFYAGGRGDPFLSLHREMNRLFDDVLRGSATGPSENGDLGFVPAHINVSETADDLRVTAELPGVAPEDVDITLDNGVLTIRGEKRFEKKDEKESFHFVERSYGSFQRSLRLPFAVSPNQVHATFDNGVLTVSIPKSKAQEQSTRVQIQGRSGQGEKTSASANAPSKAK
ncbi:Hsp20/alpha crystallin family protein [Microvirga puerhi]|uniref:Hsp20/alpha crystallin family protein n=1 Tax=Microvirga puerhi TaxID=2876078 RepID=A0ABS7VTA1_9HYPH|nr:Hsp20/alpha crystallin family protein [Microvirga puerhi]MBZ6078798.1 Hsp20/alpha crystallin family protein [Microvirga puerhi]